MTLETDVAVKRKMSFHMARKSHGQVKCLRMISKFPGIGFFSAVAAEMKGKTMAERSKNGSGSRADGNLRRHSLIFDSYGQATVRRGHMA